MLSTIVGYGVFAYLLVFTRLGMAVLLMPAFSVAYLNTQVRLALALTLALVITPLVASSLPAEQPRGGALALLVVSEVLIGAFVAMVMQALHAALHLGGTAIGFASGLMNARAFDPTTSQSGAMVLTFLTLLATVLIFFLDLHHLMIEAVVDSYRLIPPGQLPEMGDLVAYLTTLLSGSFRIGWQLAAPFLLFNLIFFVSLGIMARLMPQMNVFFVGLPLQILVGLGILFVTLPALMLTFLRYYEAGLIAFMTL
ncbi:flagellar biosynthetic protein FliR [Roseospira visakhapatnamensis]|uniref:Flagellar biosynthetic protein FliR n=1 Tax=Roseospira visakhapatnamensis TaxID=390880 RepID=A0A7W6REW1_9PROT|nr:flagellar biosynthetic protein FliR [Roseospira visakhapatnamensis]MBB4266791.1 flagellar biosynthetic protein FliR [Roseospira visakhapatnamensis]